MLIYILGIIFLIAGIGIKYFKWDFLISGYNTMNEEQRANVDVKKLRNLMGNSMMIMSIFMFISAIFRNMGRDLLSLISIILIFPLILIVSVQAKKYNKNKESRGDSKFVSIFTIIIILIIGALFLYGSRDPKVNITDNRVIVEGIFGTAINKEKIQEITLENHIPNVKRKVIGFDLGYILRGIFEVEDMGRATLFINKNKSPFVIIKADNKNYIINFRDSNKTIELYNSLK